MRRISRSSSLRRSTGLRLALLGALLLALAAFSRVDFAVASTSCSTDADCPRAQLCCQEFGYFGSPKICKTPVQGHCPLVP
jgi:hypothetical protein